MYKNRPAHSLPVPKRDYGSYSVSTEPSFAKAAAGKHKARMRKDILAALA